MLADLPLYVRVALRGLRHRSELAGIELGEARDRLLIALLLLLGAALLALLAGGVLTLFVAAAFWDTAYRLHAIAILGLCHIAGAGICFLRFRQLLRTWDPFALTKEQLRQDAACIETLMDEP